MPDTENPFLASFSDPEKVANYQSGPKLFTPGLEDLHRMTTILLSERVPDDGRILVLGAGGHQWSHTHRGLPTAGEPRGCAGGIGVWRHRVVRALGVHP